MKKLLLITFLLFIISSYGQNELPKDYGFKHLQIIYKADKVDVLIKSKKGEEQSKKPLFLFCQGSLPIPLIVKYNDNGKKGIYPLFVFNPDSLANEYHLAIVNKPYIPLIADQKTLNPDLTYSDSIGKFPGKYIERNLLDYYVDRNIAVIKYLQRQTWVSSDKLVVAGHSEGSAIAAKITYKFPQVTQLIYSGGNPLGRVMTILGRARNEERDSSKNVEDIFNYWQMAVDNPNDINSTNDTYKGYYQFSVPPPLDYLSKLKIPVLVTYGTKDYGAVAANDYLRVTMIRLKKSNFTFKAYFGVEHNFFPLKANGETNFDIFNWDKVADDWRSWLKEQ